MPVAGVFGCTPLGGAASHLAFSMLRPKHTLPLAVVLQWGLLVHTIAYTHRGFAYILMPCFLWLLSTGLSLLDRLLLCGEMLCVWLSCCLLPKQVCRVGYAEVIVMCYITRVDGQMMQKCGLKVPVGTLGLCTCMLLCSLLRVTYARMCVHVHGLYQPGQF